MVLVTVSYLWLALYFHTIEWNWWIGLLAVIIDEIIATPFVRITNNSKMR